jgi:hypothetical protein
MKNAHKPKARKPKTLSIDGATYTFHPGGAVAVEDCNRNPIGEVSAKMLDAIVALSVALAAAIRDIEIGEHYYQINYNDDGVVNFDGARYFNLADLKRLQKVSKLMRK